ncbi:MAG: Putrescine transport ATP-binding protein PotA, partial [uncultured Microvirga sp.]
TAGRDRARHYPRLAPHPSRRAALQPRCQAARADAGRAARPAQGRRRVRGLRDPRPGGGAGPVRPDRGDERRAHRRDRHAARAVPRAQDPLRGVVPGAGRAVRGHGTAAGREYRHGDRSGGGRGHAGSAGRKLRPGAAGGHGAASPRRGWREPVRGSADPIDLQRPPRHLRDRARRWAPHLGAGATLYPVRGRLRAHRGTPARSPRAGHGRHAARGSTVM